MVGFNVVELNISLTDSVSYKLIIGFGFEFRVLGIAFMEAYHTVFDIQDFNKPKIGFASAAP